MRRPPVVLLAFAAASAAALAAGPPEPAAAAGPAMISLDGVPQAAYVGETVTFSGWLTGQDGEPVAGRVVEIKDDDPGFDDFLASGATDAGGRFAIQWAVDAGREGDSTLEVYAVFEGDSEYGRDRTPNHDMTVRERAPAAAAQAPAPAAAGRGQALVTLDSVPRSAYDGEDVLFTGRLVGHDGSPLAGRTVEIKDNDPGRDDFLTYGVTDRGGYFAAYWTVDAGREGDGTLDIYAVFEGDSSYRRHQTRDQEMTVRERAGSITLGRVPHTAYAGDTVTFTGSLSSGRGEPLAGRTVTVKDNDLGRDDFIASAVTDGAGRFAASWVVRDDWEGGLEVYAVFDGDSSYGRDQSPNQHMLVQKRGGTLTLDPIPPEAREGSVIDFTGRLALDGRSPEGAVVYVKDEDTLNPDDLLAVAYVEASGRFNARWIVEGTDPTPAAEIFAVFEGNDVFSRLVSEEYKMAVLDSAPLILPPVPVPGPIPPPPAGLVVPPGGPPGDQYMSMYYALDGDMAPHVAIVPSPDSYNKVKRIITPAQEGLLMWEAMLERKHGGNWDVTMEVVHPKSWFESRPDVIMRLVHHDKDSKCFRDYYGAAFLPLETPEHPVQTRVCSTSGGAPRDAAGVRATAAHEFIHAVGLGHTFNIQNDMMCSSEGGVPTCPGTEGKSRMPSGLNLDSVARIYGTDGYMWPNSYVEYGDRFYAGEPLGPGSGQIVTAGPTIRVDPDSHDPGPGSGQIATVGPTVIVDPDSHDPGPGSGQIVTAGPTIRVDPDRPDPGSGQVATVGPTVIVDPNSHDPGPGSGQIVTAGPTVHVEQEQPPGGDCLIATAAHGTDLAPAVQRLREARDGMLSSDVGAGIMGAIHAAYYAISPAIADMGRASSEIGDAVRVVITPPLAALSLL